MRAILLGLIVLPGLAAAAVDTVAALEQRLRTESVDALNASLLAQAPTLAELAQRTADCNTQAVGLAVRLSRGKASKAVEAHREALRIAVGTCTENVLSLLSSSEVPRICASAASWTVMQTVRELRRRIHAIETDPALRSTERGKACAAAYLDELKTTRVGLRVKAARTP